MSDYTHKQILVVRKDLKCRRGKEISQGCHASLGAFLKLGHFTMEGEKVTFNADIDKERIWPWLIGRFTKICVYVNSEAELLELQTKAEQAGVNFCLIQDAGFTEFNGEPTYTVLAIGPDKNEVIDELCGHLPLY